MYKVCLLFGEQQDCGKNKKKKKQKTKTKKRKQKQKQGVHKLTFWISQNQSMQYILMIRFKQK